MAREFTYQTNHSLLVDDGFDRSQGFPYDFTNLSSCENCDNCRFTGTENCLSSCHAETAYESEEDYAYFPTEAEANAWDEQFA